jgi:hypothetical protein
MAPDLSNSGFVGLEATSKLGAIWSFRWVAEAESNLSFASWSCCKADFVLDQDAKGDADRCSEVWLLDLGNEVWLRCSLLERERLVSGRPGESLEGGDILGD